MAYKLLCITLFILGTIAEKVMFLEPCHVEDNECILNSAKKATSFVAAGIPELGVPSGDPLVVEKDIIADNGELKLKLKNVKAEGASKCKLTKFERNYKKSTMLTTMECPIKITGQYSLGGKVAFIDGQGEGNFEMKTENIRLIINLSMKPYEKDGHKHYKFSTNTLKYEPVERIYFNFENLFNGDKKKAEPILAILNESWKELTESVGKPIMADILSAGVSVINKLFEVIPGEELELV